MRSFTLPNGLKTRISAKWLPGSIGHLIELNQGGIPDGFDDIFVDASHISRSSIGLVKLSDAMSFKRSAPASSFYL
jgi:hypothetical protein